MVADGYGGKGYLVGFGDDIESTLKEAQRVSRDQDLPVLINALIGQSDFRAGSISV